jgi:MoxR-like ATPase
VNAEEDSAFSPELERGMDSSQASPRPQPPRVWVEKTHLHNRPDRQDGPHRLGEALWSPQRSKSGSDIYANMRDVRPADIILHLTDDEAITATSVVTGPLQENFIGLPETEWANRPCYRIPLGKFQPLEPPLRREWFFEDAHIAEQLQAIAQQPRGRGLFYNKELSLNQGNYLTEVPPSLQSVLDATYSKHTGHHLPNIPSVASTSDLVGEAPLSSENGMPEGDQVGANTGRRVWIWAPGEQAAYWDELYESGIMALGWNAIGDFQKYRTVDTFKSALESSTDSDKDQGQNAKMCFDFVYAVKPGDIVFAKRGRRTIVGRGVVTGEYRYDAARTSFHSVRAVQWTTRGEWAWPELLPMKTLTELTDPVLITNLEQLLAASTSEVEGGAPAVLPPSDRESYAVDEALEGLFMSRDQFEQILQTWLRKKNLILQGAPGVGKSFVARRFAYALMRFKDPTRVRTVQFHQSYSYEDFVQGYRPAGHGFALRDGVFLNFCNRALRDSAQTYVFIIDEINRGNLSKIFGELLLLIEADKRSPEWAVKLAYAESADERFYIPPNVFVLGMMNSADRSLAVVDYALRRRFAFATIKPAFDQHSFREYLSAEGAAANLIDRIIERMSSLNEAIAADVVNLGPGFCIGHSFFTPREAGQTPTAQWYEMVVKSEIVPLLEEYWFDQPETAAHWRARLLE